MRSKAISRAAVDAAVVRVAAAAYEIPTDRPESDGTFEWTSTTLVVAEVDSAEAQGIGYTYAPRAAARVIADTLAPVVCGRDAMDVTAAWMAMRASVRNQGLPGICAEAIAAVDSALWDLKARLLALPLATLLGSVRPAVPVYGSGGFTSYSVDELCRQLGNWVESGIPRVKMKVGRDRHADPGRVDAARHAIGDSAELFVDANGAWTSSQAAAMAERFAESRVSWFEEPVTSDDLDGMRRVRDGAPAGMAVAAGEYGYDLAYFRRMLQAGAVDVLQADASRCGGISGFLAAGALADAFTVPVSAHTAPLLHLAACCALPRVAHIEYFHDHVRIEQMLFDGMPRPHGGALSPDLSRPGLGLAFKRADAAPYRVM
jgi:L-alanine-DL-glutamate epimerase-like enolase superfamily enzyme